MTGVFSTVFGILLLAVVFYDVYATILRATERPGPISKFLNGNLWWLATRATRKMRRRTRHRILSAIGPLLMPLLVILLISVLITGFALIYLPQMNDGFRISNEERSNPILQAFYFSGVTLLTIGYGDIIPSSGLMRLLALAEGITGIAVISLSITYLLTVYDALVRKRAVALTFYHEARQGADVTGFIARHFVRGEFPSLTDTLRDARRDLHELLESHLEHPVIHYFHSLEVYKGLPRALFFVLETTSVLRSCLDARTYVEADEHPDVIITEESARHVLAELVTSLDLTERATESFEPAAETAARRRACFERTMRRLEAANIKTNSDRAAAFSEYDARRETWERELYRFADFLGYDWEETTGDYDLENAAEGEIVDRHEPLNEATAEETTETADFKQKEI